MAPTIKDVAKAAGVSITTVSRVLNQYTDVNAKTRTKVLKVVEKLGYKPNAVARSLVMNRTRTIGLLVAELSRTRNAHHFMYDVICGVNDRAQELDYDLVLFSTSRTEQKRLTYMDYVNKRRVDGVLMIGMRLDNPYTREVIDASVPSVLIDLPLTGETCSYVMTDNVAGARMAVEHLLSLGHSKIGFVNGHPQAAVSIDRLRGYQDALQAAGIEYDSSRVYYGDFKSEDGVAGTDHLLQAHPELTAIFYASDLMAIGAIKMLQGQGKSIPDDLSIVGFDDIDLSTLIEPQLTTIRQNRYEMGRVAADTVIRMLGGEDKGRGIVLSPELVVRGTTGAIEK